MAKKSKSEIELEELEELIFPETKELRKLSVKQLLKKLKNEKLKFERAAKNVPKILRALEAIEKKKKERRNNAKKKKEGSCT